MGEFICQFCEEINGSERTRFHDIYGSILHSRIVADHRNFVAFPTLGQLLPGSVLVVTKKHIETFAQLTRPLHEEALNLIRHLEAKLRCYGHVLLFEHGARSAHGGGCGIYHAHLHLVPLPEPTTHDELVDVPMRRPPNLSTAWDETKDCPEYLTLRDPFGTVAYHVPRGSTSHLQSQYCRRRIAEHFRLERPWDWRAYDFIEPFLLDTVETLRTTQVQGIHS